MSGGIEVRVRISLRGRNEGTRAASRGSIRSALSGIATLLAVSCAMLASWRLTADLGWTDEFAIADGLFSHWQVWLALAIGFGILAVRWHRDVSRLEAARISSTARVPQGVQLRQRIPVSERDTETPVDTSVR